MTTPTPIEALREREAFEAWAAGWGFDLAPADSKTYIGLLTQCAWLGWQGRAALAAPQAEKAEPVCVRYDSERGVWTTAPTQPKP